MAIGEVARDITTIPHQTPHIRMDRRAALKRVGAVLGGTLSLPVVSAVMSGCQAQTEGYTYQALTPEQGELVATLAELIIPTTDTPGARAVGVDAFIDRLLTDWFDDDSRNQFMAGLEEVDTKALEANDSRFIDNTEAQQVELLTELDEAAYRGDSDAPPFFRTMKELTLTGYYTSEIGASQELKYVHVAGEYRGDVPYTEIGRAFS